MLVKASKACAETEEHMEANGVSPNSGSSGSDVLSLVQLNVLVLKSKELKCTTIWMPTCKLDSIWITFLLAEFIPDSWHLHM